MKFEAITMVTRKTNVFEDLTLYSFVERLRREEAGESI
jgi:hypothetical protein